MPWESIGVCGTAQFPRECGRMTAEVRLGASYVRLICGEPPSGCDLGLMWHEHDLGRYPTVGVYWEPAKISGPPLDYIQRAADVLSRFHDAVDWEPIEPNEDEEDEENGDEEMLEEYEEEGYEGTLGEDDEEDSDEETLKEKPEDPAPELPKRGGSEPPVISPATARVCASCMGLLLQDEPWRILGFEGVPRYSRIAQKLRPAWKVDLEHRVMQEMLVAFTAAHIASGRLTPDEVHGVIAGYTYKPDVVETLGYTSVPAAVQHLTEGIAEYRSTLPSLWDELVCKHVDPAAIPDEQLSARLMVGCIHFGQDLTNLVLGLRAPVPEDRP